MKYFLTKKNIHEKRKKWEFQQLYSGENIRTFIRNKWIEWLGHN